MVDIVGTNGDDRLIGNVDKDLIRGLAGDDVLRGDLGFDNLFGGNGSDRLFGGSGEDDLYGDAGSDLLFGGSGDDFLSGGLGGDVLNGGTGSDRYFGGAGRDRFVFDESLVDQGVEGDPESIGDFATGDRIDLSLIDADRTRPGNQNFVFVEDGFVDGPGEVGYDDEDSGAYLFGYTDEGDDSYFEIYLGFVPPLTAEDVIL